MRNHRPALAVVALLGAAACVPYQDRTMRCPDTHPGLTVAEILAELDIDGDGQFDEHDVEPGSSVQLFRFTEASGEERLVVSRDEGCGMNISHNSGPPDDPWDEVLTLFGPWHEFTECSAFGWSTLWAFSPTPEAPDLVSGQGELYHLAFDIAEIEHGNISVEHEVEGWMEVVVQGGRYSGHLLGSASTDIITYFTQERTGERVEIIAQAFHELPYSP